MVKAAITEAESRWPCETARLLAQNTADSLSDAWAEAEAAMPKGWGSVALFGYRVPRGGSVYIARVDPLGLEAQASTPAEALRALAAKIREMNG